MLSDTSGLGIRTDLMPINCQNLGGVARDCRADLHSDYFTRSDNRKFVVG